MLRGLVNGTIVGVAMQFASGVPIGLRTNPGEINNDGVASDRPSGVPRNSLNFRRAITSTPPVAPDRVGGATKAEVIAELKNVFNTVQWSPVNGTAIAGTRHRRPIGLPGECDLLPPSGGYEQRQFQLGFKFIF